MKRFLVLFGLLLLLSSVFSETTYTNTTKTECFGRQCTKTIYSGIAFVEEDGEWKPIQEAKSWFDYYDIVFLEKEDAFDMNVTDFNFYEINIDTVFKGHPLDYPEFCTYKSEEEFKCQFKNVVKWLDDEGVEQTIKFDMKYEMKDGIIVANDVKFQYKGNPLGKEFTFGGNSTTLILQDADTENLEDTYINSRSVASNYSTEQRLNLVAASGDSKHGLIKFDITSIPADVIIENADLNFYCYYEGLSAGEITDVNIYHIYQSWTWEEQDITWNSKPADDGSDYNLTKTGEGFQIGDGSTGSWFQGEVTNAVSQAYSDSDANISFYLKTTVGSPGNPPEWYDNHYLASKEYPGASNRPKLEITYSSGSVSYDFTVSLPASGCLQYEGSTDADSTCERCFAEPTDTENPINSNDLNCQGQNVGNGIAFLQFNFTGSAETFDLNMDLNATPPTGLAIKAMCNSGNPTSAITLTTTSQVICNDITPSGTQDANIFLWLNWTDYNANGADYNVTRLADVNSGA